ncbi:uncharacterized protein [Callorhinus ursinus]|uniref:uncharacterized protein n=1 Tax=Callorhinus ursinus TaxID=34884 RepID=UPI003CD01482
MKRKKAHPRFGSLPVAGLASGASWRYPERAGSRSGRARWSPAERGPKLASAPTPELGPVWRPRGRPRSRRRPPPAPPAARSANFPPSPGGRRPAPRGDRVPSPAAAAACGRVGEGPPPPPHPTGLENKAAAAAALTFSVSDPRSLRRLLTEASSAGREKLRSRQRLDSRRGASEASRASQDPACRWRPFLPPSSPSRLEAPGAGGRGVRGGGARPARGLPGAVVSGRARAGGSRAGMSLCLCTVQGQRELCALGRPCVSVGAGERGATVYLNQLHMVLEPHHCLFLFYRPL